MLTRFLVIALACAAVSALAAGPARAGGVAIQEAYARTSSPVATSGAAFMQIVNTGTEDDRLLSVRSDVAARVELHTHVETADGVMQMVALDDGMVIPAGGLHHLKRGGDHVMFMGLSGPWATGDVVTVTMTFERAGEMVVEIPVDLDRQPDADAPSH